MIYEQINIKQGEYTPLAPYNSIKGLWVIIFPIDEFEGEADGDRYANAMRVIMGGTPTLDGIKDIILGYHNQSIDRAILSGHKWKGMQVWLSAENQQNYKASFDLAMQFQGQGGTLPLTYKFGTELEPQYYTFETLEELTEFYVSTVQYVKTILAEGWKRKDAIEWTLYEEALKQYE